MRAKHVTLFAFAALLVLFAGCVGNETDAPDATVAPKVEVSLEQAVIDTLCTPEMRWLRNLKSTAKA